MGRVAGFGLFCFSRCRIFLTLFVTIDLKFLDVTSGNWVWKIGRKAKERKIGRSGRTWESRQQIRRDRQDGRTRIFHFRPTIRKCRWLLVALWIDCCSTWGSGIERHFQQRGGAQGRYHSHIPQTKGIRAGIRIWIQFENLPRRTRRSSS